MGDIRYRLYLDDKPASREQLDQVEEVSVKQEIDAAWEARLLIPICTDDQGNWGGIDSAFTQDFKRVRVELDPGDGKFVPLIDGPIVGADRDMNSEPGQSNHTVVVMDDSVFLNRKETQFRFEKKLPHEMAEQLFKQAEEIKTHDISHDTKPPPDGIPAVQVERGTALQVLRKLGKVHGMNAYVLPGPKAGKSIGVFKPLTTKPDGLPPLILLGADRNVSTFNATNNAQGPADLEAQTLSINDKTVRSAHMSFRDVALLGDKPAVAALKAEAKRLLPPGKDGQVDPKKAVEAAAKKLAFGFKAQGTVVSNCYGAVLTPYRVVTVKGVDETQSGNYTIQGVDHKLGRSAYEQSFTLIRNAKSEKKGGGLLPKIF